jgi:hypothetical protein
MPRVFLAQPRLTTTGALPVWFEDLIDGAFDGEEVYGPLDAPTRIPCGSTLIVGRSVMPRSIPREGRLNWM